MSTQQRQIVFVKSGSFSGVNRNIEAVLRKYFPEFEICVIDIMQLLRTHPLQLLTAMIQTFACKPRLLFRRHGKVRRTFYHHLWRSPYTFALISRLVHNVTLQRYSKAAFILQTQSLWNSAAANIPYFIYTDSAALTNLYYPSFLPKDLPPAHWIDQERRAFEGARIVFVWSNHVLRSMLEHYHLPQERVINIHAGSNLVAVPPTANPAPANNKAILFVGIEWERKGGPELIEAFSRLPERHKDAHLIIVGCNPDIKIRNCTIAGRVPRSDMPSYYEKASIFCLPTRNEPFGISFVEALSQSLAAVSPNLGAMPDYIKHKVTGMLHKTGDTDGILECLTWLLDNPQERIAIATRGYEAVKNSYTWDAVGERLRQEIAKIIPLT